MELTEAEQEILRLMFRDACNEIGTSPRAGDAAIRLLQDGCIDRDFAYLADATGTDIQTVREAAGSLSEMELVEQFVGPCYIDESLCLTESGVIVAARIWESRGRGWAVSRDAGGKLYRVFCDSSIIKMGAGGIPDGGRLYARHLDTLIWMAERMVAELRAVREERARQLRERRVRQEARNEKRDD